MKRSRLDRIFDEERRAKVEKMVTMLAVLGYVVLSHGYGSAHIAVTDKDGQRRTIIVTPENVRDFLNAYPLKRGEQA